MRARRRYGCFILGLKYSYASLILKTAAIDKRPNSIIFNGTFAIAFINKFKRLLFFINDNFPANLDNNRVLCNKLLQWHILYNLQLE
ncbi:hypothetical protein RIR_jg18125.t1 [Rhizophagus irregularis DAOM 181602=DAOM 197198]|nr:hypothetical protein RIR_jg18125.t1 [Rhizophagus irregularis DAOM 181602=DAOM 197198]